MAQWLRRRHSCMKCTVHDLEVMDSNPGRVELGVHSTSIWIFLYLPGYGPEDTILLFIFFKAFIYYKCPHQCHMSV